ncbi:MAG: GNAT family N-acetyltransferase [Acetobacteraceae bacterium]|nr:GNAT family N-acetyltransferase [Acetobacteraceae bacterium]
MTIPELRGARLTLRGFREADLDAFAAMQADPEVMRFLGPTGLPRGRAETWQTMAMLLGHWQLRGFGLWAVEHEGRFVGRVGWLEPEGWPARELAYALARPAWGQGLAFEAASAALAWGRSRWPGLKLASFIRPENEPSRRLAAKLGARCAGRIELMGGVAEEWRHGP